MKQFRVQSVYFASHLLAAISLLCKGIQWTFPGGKGIHSILDIEIENCYCLDSNHRIIGLSWVELPTMEHRSSKTVIQNCGNSLYLCVSRTTNKSDVQSPTLPWIAQQGMMHLNPQKILISINLLETSLVIRHTRMMLYD